jgi:hypothetical protein
MNAVALTTIENRVRIHCIQYFLHPVHGETLLAGTDDQLIRIYSVSDGKAFQELKGHRARYIDYDIPLIVVSKHSAPPLYLMVMMFE